MLNEQTIATLHSLKLSGMARGIGGAPGQP